ncbi:MAG: DUF2066 domain-containing protein [Hyphomicrobiales bacterium]
MVMGRWLARLSLAIFLAGGLIVFGGARQAALADAWRVSNVKVDVTAENAPEAKMIAIGEAQLIAFKRLIDRVVPAENAAKLRDLPPKSVRPLMASVSIQEESVAPKRYIAKLSVRFLQGKTKALLASYGVKFAEKQSDPVLLVPIWLGPEGADMWSKDNPLRRAWDDIDLENALVPFVIATGDRTDKETITPAEALQGNWQKLQGLQLRYGASTILVAAAQPKSDISLRAVMFGSSPVGNIKFDNEYSGDDLEAAAKIAARTQFQAVQERWKKKNLVVHRRSVSNGSANVVKIAVPLTNLAEWNVLRSRIQATNGVGRIDVNSLSARGAIISIAFAGSLNQLRNAFYQTGFSLQQNRGTWVLRPQ